MTIPKYKTKTKDSTHTETSIDPVNLLTQKIATMMQRQNTIMQRLI